MTAAPSSFNWSAPVAWVDSVPGVASAVPNNTVISYIAGARYYDVILSNPGTITLDMDPTIDTLKIAGTQSELVLPAGFMLTTVLSTTLSAGTLAMSGGVLSSPEMLINGGLLTGNGTIVAAGGNNGSTGWRCWPLFVPHGLLRPRGETPNGFAESRFGRPLGLPDWPGVQFGFPVPTQKILGLKRARVTRK